MRDGSYATELRAELERAVGNYRSRAKWYIAGAAAAAAAAAVIVAAVVAGSGGPSGSSGVREAGTENAPSRAASPLGGGAVGELGNDVHAGDPTNGVSVMENRAGFSVVVPSTADANSSHLTGTYALPGKTVEMDFPPPDEASKELQPPYIAVTEFPAAEEAQKDPAAEIDRYLEAAHNAGLSQQSACSVGHLSAMCVPANAGGVNAVAKPGGGYTYTKYPYPNAAYVGFFMGNLEIHIAGGTSVDDLIKIGESMSSNGSPSQTSTGG